jgi:hypothetical protein
LYNHRTIIIPQATANRIYIQDKISEYASCYQRISCTKNPQKRKREEKNIPPQQTTLTAHNTYMR